MNVTGKYFKNATIPPATLTFIIGVILIASHDGSSYKSEWFTSDGFTETVLLTFLLSSIIVLLSTTIFLNSLVQIRSMALLSFGTWILLPGLVCGFVIYQEADNFLGSPDIDGVYEGNRLLDGYILTVAILHLLFLVISFVRFRRTQ